MPLIVHNTRTMSRCARSLDRIRGFSLLEFAIVLAVFAMVLGTFLVPLTKQIEQQRYTETQRILASARDTLVSFAAANGRLPCPAVYPGVALKPPSAEAFSVLPIVGNETNGSCLNFFAGYLPAATLGFSPVDDEGYAVDAWGLKQNRIRYAVSPDGLVVGDFIFTKANGIKNAVNAIELISNGTVKFLYVCSDTPTPPPANTCGGATVSLANGNAIAVIYSLGANAAEPPGPATAEFVNYPITKSDPVFVSHSLRTTAADPFDDVVTWIGPNMLVGRMIASGKLP